MEHTAERSVAIQASKITPINSLAPTPHEMTVFEAMALRAHESKMYRGIGDISGIMAIMLSARELGIPPMQALNGGLHIIEGKVEISARMMSAMIRRAGHSIQIKESTDEICTLHGTRADNGDAALVSYSIQDAQKAGLIREKGGWKRNPKDMCFARAMSRLSRQLFSDVIGIGYVEGEISQKDPQENIQHVQAAIVSEAKEEDPIEDDSTVIARFLEQFPSKEERQDWRQFMEVVGKHFEWTPRDTLREFEKDMNQTKEKFNKWIKKK